MATAGMVPLLAPGRNPKVMFRMKMGDLGALSEVGWTCIGPTSVNEAKAATEAGERLIYR